ITPRHRLAIRAALVVAQLVTAELAVRAVMAAYDVAHAPSPAASRPMARRTPLYRTPAPYHDGIRSGRLAGAGGDRSQEDHTWGTTARETGSRRGSGGASAPSGAWRARRRPRNRARGS